MKKLPPEKLDGIPLTKEQLKKFFDVFGDIKTDDMPKVLRKQAM